MLFQAGDRVIVNLSGRERQAVVECSEAPGFYFVWFKTGPLANAIVRQERLRIDDEAARPRTMEAIAPGTADTPPGTAG
jgi:hypothetical protein